MRNLILYLGAMFLAIAVAPVASPAFAQEEVVHPWERDRQVLTAADADSRVRGIEGLAAHIEPLEAALAGASQAFEAAAAGDEDSVYVLVDGATQTMAAIVDAAGTAEAGGSDARSIVAVENPYLMIAFYLGTYYNEYGLFTDAVRVLSAGLALPEMFPELGETRVLLMIERAAALGQTGDREQALAAYDEVLQRPGLATPFRASALRGRGFSLIELGRLDEAEAAYRASLEIDPDNPIAMNELTYIAGLRQGREKAPAILATPDKAAEALAGQAPQ
ncbi:MAG: tetratricopeptide repeat protein [Hyphomonadaceae bacterium]